MVANIGVIIGPIIGGLTSDPVANYPGLFGGIKWLERFPYSPPNLISAFFLSFAVIVVFFGLEEVSFNCGRNGPADFDRRIKISTTKMTSVLRSARKPAHACLDVLDRAPNLRATHLSIWTTLGHQW